MNSLKSVLCGGEGMRGDMGRRHGLSRGAGRRAGGVVLPNFASRGVGGE